MVIITFPHLTSQVRIELEYAQNTYIPTQREKVKNKMPNALRLTRETWKDVQLVAKAAYGGTKLRRFIRILRKQFQEVASCKASPCDRNAFLWSLC